MKIFFLPDNKTVETDGSESVLSAASKAGVIIDGNCGGAGTCGKCKVQVTDGSQKGFHLACRLFPEGDMTVQVPQYSESLKRKSEMSSLMRGLSANSGFEKRAAEPEKALLEDQKSDEERLKAALFPKGGGEIASSLLGELQTVMGGAVTVTATVRGKEIIHIEEGDKSGECYGLSFDVGTTTVVGMLVNLISGEVIGMEAEANPQAAHGADVISRIMFAGESRENLKLMQSEIVKCLNRIAEGLAGTHGVSMGHIYDSVVAGNTTMSHLLLGVDPKRLALVPFTPVFCEAARMKAGEFGLKINRMADVTLLPNIAGHVGSDITAGIVASGIIEKRGNHLLIDVGTNGEIVLCADGRAVCCSTAAGPAFEGASIYQGMRAASGAIERVDITENGVSIRVIGGKKPSGICGSGIIDAVSELFKAGLIDRTGKLFTREKALEKGIAAELAGRLRDGKTGREFVLAYIDDADDVAITQKDIREVQLAKAAMRAGIGLLMKEFGLAEKDLQYVYIAGAFGNHIRTESAVGIGLIPDIGEEKILYIGNAAGIGAVMALLSLEARGHAKETAKKIRHIELAVDPSFQEVYLAAMAF